MSYIALDDTTDPPKVETLEDAAFWIDVMHRRTCSDSRRLFLIEERLREMERPWWRRRRG